MSHTNLMGARRRNGNIGLFTFEGTQNKMMSYINQQKELISIINEDLSIDLKIKLPILYLINGGKE